VRSASSICFWLARRLSLQMASSAASRITLARKCLARATCSSREYTLSGRPTHEAEESGVVNRDSSSELRRVMWLAICSETLRFWRGLRLL